MFTFESHKWLHIEKPRKQCVCGVFVFPALRLNKKFISVLVVYLLLIRHFLLFINRFFLIHAIVTKHSIVSCIGFPLIRGELLWKGITNLAKGKVFEMILNDFRCLGYKVKYKILNAADYGVPQTRQRVIIIGVRNDIDFDYEYPNPTHDKNGANGLPKWVSVGKTMSEIIDPDTPNAN